MKTRAGKAPTTAEAKRSENHLRGPRCLKRALVLVFALGLMLPQGRTAPQPTPRGLPRADPSAPARASDLTAEVNRLVEAGRALDALSLAREALRTREERLGPVAPQTLEALDNLAGVYLDVGDYSQAEPLYERALKARQGISAQSAQTATTLNDLGRLCLLMGSYAKALPRFEESLAIRRAALGETNSNTAATLNNLAVVCAMMGDFPRALPFARRAAEVFQQLEVPEAAQAASSLDNLATLCMLGGDDAQAEALYQRALRIRERVSGPEAKETAVVLENLGCLYRAEMKLTNAQPLFERALRIDERTLGRDDPQTAVVLNDLGELRTSAGDLEQAESILWRALGIAEQCQSLSLLNRVQLSLRDLLAKQRRTEAAIFIGKQAVNRLQWMRGRQLSVDKELQGSFLGIHSDYYRGLAALLVDAGRFAEAQQVLGMLKEEEYFEFIRRDAGAARQLTTRAGLAGVEEDCEKGYGAIRSKLVALAMEKRALIKKTSLTTADEARLDQLSQMLSTATQRFSRVLEQLKREAPAESMAKDPDYLADIKAMRATLEGLGHGCVLLHYFITPQKLYILLTTKEAQTHAVVDVDQQALNRRVWEFRQALQNPRLDAVPAARELYNLMLRPIAGDLAQAGAATLMVSLDGVLQYVPLGALHDGTGYIVERYRFVSFTDAMKDKLRVEPTRPWRAAGLGLSRKVEGFEPLPHVKEELAGIVRMDGSTGGVLPGIIRMDDAFTRRELERNLGANIPVVHIASHFVFAPGKVDESYLLLGSGERLTLEGMRNADLDFRYTDLLTLSACETGISERRLGNGTELEGFARLAQHQGAKAILATLWPVADLSTCEFMKGFYSYHQGPLILCKAEALQRAQVAFLKGAAPGASAEMLAKADVRGVHRDERSSNGAKAYTPNPDAPYAHPYYWAPFVLTGNWL